MKTEHKLVEALKEMMSVMPLDSISVSSLSAKCDINRKTFYYHFHDIYDLLTQAFLDEKIEGLNAVSNPQQLLIVIHKYYMNNRGFVDGTLASAGKDLFKEFVYNNCYNAFLKMINGCPSAKKVHASDKKIVVRFYTSGFADAIVFFLNNSRSKDINGLKNYVAFLGDNFLEDALQNVIEIKEKKL